MREIICLQIGQCGNAIGTQFWDIVCADHGLNQAGCYIGKASVQLEKINVYFTERRGLQYTPRAVMIDLDKTSMEAVRSAPYGQIFNEKNFIFGNRGTGNNWAKGHFTEGAQLCDLTLDVIRREVEGCDCFHGFQLAHSIGGGTGAGLGSLLIDKLKQEYTNCVISSFSIIPSPKVSNCVVEPYNAVLTINHLVESAHETFCVDNEALYFITSNTLKLGQAAYCDLNYLISMVMSGVTTCMRFPGPHNTSLRKIAVNMVPFPRLHFFVPGYAPLLSKSSRSYRKFSLAEIAKELFDYKNMFAACDARQGKFLTVACIFRGEISTREIDRQMFNIQNRDSPNFVEWIPDNIKTAVCYIPPPGMTTSATFVGNTTAVQDLFKRIRQQYLSMIRRKAFLHWFTGEGMEEIEFHTAEANLNDLIEEYQNYETVKSDISIPQSGELHPIVGMRQELTGILALSGSLPVATFPTTHDDFLIKGGDQISNQGYLETDEKIKKLFSYKIFFILVF